MSRRPSHAHERSRQTLWNGGTTAYTLQQARLAIAIHLYRCPDLLDEVDQHLAGTPVTEVVAELADLIHAYPHLCSACAGSLLGIAEQSGRSEEVIAQFSFLHFMPDDFVSQLPALQIALEMIAERREPLAPLGMAMRWRYEVVNGNNGQRHDSPGTWKLDHLWRAACYELAALEHQSLGLVAAAEEMMTAAARAFQDGVATR